MRPSKENKHSRSCNLRNWLDDKNNNQWNTNHFRQKLTDTRMTTALIFRSSKSIQPLMQQHNRLCKLQQHQLPLRFTIKTYTLVGYYCRYYYIDDVLIIVKSSSFCDVEVTHTLLMIIVMKESESWLNHKTHLVSLTLSLINGQYEPSIIIVMCFACKDNTWQKRILS